MVKTVNGIIVIDGCDDPNCGNNRSNRKPNEKEQASITTFYGQGSSTNPFAVPKNESPKVKDNEPDSDPDFIDDEPNTSPFMASDGEPDSPSGSSSGSEDDSGDSDQENHPPRPDYQFVQAIIDTFQFFMMESVKECFENLIQLMRLFHYVCVYYDVLMFFYSAEEFLSLDTVTINQHFRICEQLKNFKEIQFKNQLILFLRILKDLLEEEKDEFQDQQRNININVYLSLGTLENTDFFIRKIKNLLRNGRHLRYPSMTWHDRLVNLFDDLNHLNQNESHIHFAVQPYTRPEFDEYTQFERYRLLSDEEYERFRRENSPEF